MQVGKQHGFSAASFKQSVAQRTSRVVQMMLAIAVSVILAFSFRASYLGDSIEVAY